MIHIYTAQMQPATNFVDRCSEVDIVGGFEPDTLLFPDCCNQMQPAKDCVVQCYYDGLRVWCAAGCGCRDPQVIAEKKAREFANRSAAQKARWAKGK